MIECRECELLLVPALSERGGELGLECPGCGERLELTGSLSLARPAS